MQRFQVADKVVYTRHGCDPCPPEGARMVRPTTGGDSSNYLLDEFGEIVEARPDGLVLVRMDSGEERLLAASDPSLRKTNLWDHLTRLRVILRAS